MNQNPSIDSCPKCGATVPTDAPQGLCPKCVFAGLAATEPGGPPASHGDAPSLARVAAAFPQLEILELAGRGGMGFVFKARQPNLDRLVALKLLPDKLAADPLFAERFSREGRVLARLNHPHIVSIYDFGRTDEFCFLLMEFVDGVNLRQAMQAGRFSPAEALSIVPMICEALQYAHEQGVLHRDIKPENILLDARGRVKIADFGIAKLMGNAPQEVTLTGTGLSLGTPHYMAPEQLEKPSEVDHRADIYSLGVVFYEMLTGELPLGRFAPPSSKTPVDYRVDEVVFRTLEKEKERRFQSAGEVRTTVQTLAALQPFPAEPGSAATAPGAMAGPHGTAVVKPPVVSRQALLAALLTALSLLVPSVLAAVTLGRGTGGIGARGLWIAAGSFGVFGLTGTLLGWMALAKLRANQGRLAGVPLAAFAALTWPLLLLMFFLGATPLILMMSSAGPVGLGHRLLALLLPAGTLTFVLWAVHATVRWGSRQTSLPRRGVLKWAFLGLLATGLGLTSPLVLLRAARQGESKQALNTNEVMRLTITSVETLEKAGERWLAIDYVDQVGGGCEIAFGYRCGLPDYRGQTLKTSFLVQPEGAAPVRHQRIAFRLPASVSPQQLEPFVENLRKTLVAKTLLVAYDEEKTLFRLPLSETAPVALTGYVKTVASLASTQ